MDGSQRLEFSYLDPMQVAADLIAREEFAGKLYTQFEPEISSTRPSKRAFGRVNSATVFETAQMLDTESSPLLLVFGTDAAHAMQNQSRHPVYSK